MKSSILCFGSPILDSYLLVQEGVLEKYGIVKGAMVLYDDLIPPEGLRRMREDFNFTDYEMGGSAVNTAKAYALVGGKVGLVCAYGDDDKKDIIEAETKKLGMEVFPCVYSNSPTSNLMIVVTPDAQRTVSGSFFPSFHLDSSRVDFSCVQKYDYMFLESYSFTDDPKFDSIFRTLDSSEKYNKKFIFALSNPFCVSKFKNEILKFVNHKNCKVVIGNSEEFLRLYDQCKSVKELAEHLLEHNKKTDQWEVVLITDGANGAWIIHGHELSFVPAPKVDRVVDTTGAGDYFAAGVLLALLNGYGLDVASELSTVLTADIISRVGVKLSPKAVEDAKQILNRL